MNKHSEVKQLIEFIDSEFVHLGTIHSTFVRLYKTEEETRRLLLDSDAAFFSDLYIIYLNYIAVAVARLLDPPSTGQKKNKTVFTLVELTQKLHLPKSSEWHSRLVDCKTKAYNFTDPRNQLVSHFDHEANFGDGKTKAVPSFITREFNEFYECVGKLLNEIRKDFGLPPLMYDWGIAGHGGGRKLLHRLSTAFETIQIRIEQCS